VLASDPASLETFRDICERERCPFAVVGEALADAHLEVTDPHLGATPVDLPLSVLFGKSPKMRRSFTREERISRRSGPRWLWLEAGDARCMEKKWRCVWRSI